MTLALLALSWPLLGTSCRSSAPEIWAVTSLDGRRLDNLEPSDLPARWLQLEIDAAIAKHDLQPSEMSAIWVGRRLAYKGLYPQAIKWYLDALEVYPDSYRLRRHLGHRLLTIRQVPEAIQVLGEAKALAASAPNRLEPDGAPGPSGEPRSTTHGNIDYHLALAHYLMGDFEASASLWEGCAMDWAKNADSRVAALYWWTLSRIRQSGLGDTARAALATEIDESDVIENFAYLDLVRMFRSEVTAEDLLAREDRSAALDYGIARWLIAKGETERGAGLLNSLLEREGWTAFGVLAAEADVARSAAAASGDVAEPQE